MNGIYPNRITLYLRTINWTMGYYCCYDVLSPAGCSFTVEWGDGKTQTCQSHGEWIRLPHEYPFATYREEVPYLVHIWSEDKDGIIGFREDGLEMATLELDVSQCPSLQYLDYKDLNALDVSHNPSLRELNCDRCQADTLDFSHNPALEILSCQYCPHLKSLNLSRCLSLWKLDCFLCTSLTRLGLDNHSSLREVAYEDTALTGKAEKYLLYIIQQNKGRCISYLNDD